MIRLIVSSLLSSFLPFILPLTHHLFTSGVVFFPYLLLVAPPNTVANAIYTGRGGNIFIREFGQLNRQTSNPSVMFIDPTKQTIRRTPVPIELTHVSVRLSN